MKKKNQITIKNTEKKEYQKRIDNIYNNYNNDQILDLVIAAQEELNGIRPGNQNITELLETFHTFIDMYVKFILLLHIEIYLKQLTQCIHY